MKPYEKALRMSRSGLDNPPTRRLRSEGLLIGEPLRGFRPKLFPWPGIS
jgi:hypothetical protein